MTHNVFLDMAHRASPGIELHIKIYIRHDITVSNISQILQNKIHLKLNEDNSHVRGISINTNMYY